MNSIKIVLQILRLEENPWDLATHHNFFSPDSRSYDGSVLFRKMLEQLNNLDGGDEFAYEMWEQVTGSLSFVSFFGACGEIRSPSPTVPEF